MKKMIAILFLLCIFLPGCKKKVESDNLQNENTSNAETQTTTESRDNQEDGVSTKETEDTVKFEVIEGGMIDYEDAKENASNNNDSPVADTETETEENKSQGNKENTSGPDKIEEIPQKQGCGCEYQAYLEKSPEQQEVFMDSFPSTRDFINWCREKEKEHEAHITTIIISDGELDVSKIIP